MAQDSVPLSKSKKELKQLSNIDEKKGNKLKYIKNNYFLYLFLAPAIISIFIFNYIPMYGILIAFQDFSVTKGIFGSDWVGLDHFIGFLTSPNFLRIFLNTIKLSVLGLIIGFPAPVILALMLNLIKRAGIKKIFSSLSMHQTLSQQLLFRVCFLFFYHRKVQSIIC